MKKSITWFKKGKIVRVNDKMQTNYSYRLTEDYGDLKDEEFKPELTPMEMLKMGVFEGKYITDCEDEFPMEWYAVGKMADKPQIHLNFFKIKSRQSLQEWRRKHWIIYPDVRGWFQWYCRYYIGRRLPEVDKIQIRRWKAFSRHKAQILRNCKPDELTCRPRQRQGLLQWAYNPIF